MTHPAEYNTTECETICMKCGDANKTRVDNQIIDQIIDQDHGVKREVKMAVGCPICKHDQFLLIVPQSKENIIDDMYQKL